VSSQRRSPRSGRDRACSHRPGDAGVVQGLRGTPRRRSRWV